MLDLVNISRNYPPDMVAAMTTAFEKVCQSLSASVSRSDDVRKKLALVILQHVDLGESDPEKLAEVALRELTGSDRSNGTIDYGKRAFELETKAAQATNSYLRASYLELARGFREMGRLDGVTKPQSSSDD